MRNYTTITDQARRVWTDDNGWLRIEGVELTRETVNKYLGKELDPDGEHGLEPEKVYNVYRSPEALDGAIDEFTTIDVSNEHDMDEPDNHIVSKGSVASAEIKLDNGQKVVQGDVVIKDKPNIDAIAKKVLNAFSVGYKSVLDFVAGTTPWGEPYDVKIVKIIPNHLKLTNNPRVKTATITDEDFRKFDILAKKDNNKNIHNIKDTNMKLSQIMTILKKKSSLKDEEIQELEKEMTDADYASRFRAALQEAGVEEEMIEKLMAAITPIIEDIKSEDAEVEKATAAEESKEVEKPVADVEVDPDAPAIEAEPKEVEDSDGALDIETIRKEARAAAEQVFKELAVAKEEVKDCFGNIKVADDATPKDWYRAGCKMFGLKVESIKDEDLKVAFQTAKQVRESKPVKGAMKDDKSVNAGVKSVVESLNKIKAK